MRGAVYTPSGLMEPPLDSYTNHETLLVVSSPSASLARRFILLPGSIIGFIGSIAMVFRVKVCVVGETEVVGAIRVGAIRVVVVVVSDFSVVSVFAVVPFIVFEVAEVPVSANEIDTLTEAKRAREQKAVIKILVLCLFTIAMDYTTSGKESMKCEPTPFIDSTDIRPAIFSIIWAVIHRPSPVPFMSSVSFVLIL